MYSSGAYMAPITGLSFHPEAWKGEKTKRFQLDAGSGENPLTSHRRARRSREASGASWSPLWLWRCSPEGRRSRAEHLKAPRCGPPPPPG